MEIPNAQSAHVARAKVIEYLLSELNPEGRDKARFFLRFGFSSDRWDEFAEALKSHAISHNTSHAVESPYGTRYWVDGELETPDGRNPQIRTVWQIDTASSVPRLLTAYPLKR